MVIGKEREKIQGERNVEISKKAMILEGGGLSSHPQSSPNTYMTLDRFIPYIGTCLAFFICKMKFWDPGCHRSAFTSDIQCLHRPRAREGSRLAHSREVGVAICTIMFLGSEREVPLSS